MNTGDIVKVLAAKLEISEKSARVLLRQRLHLMADMLKQHDTVPLPGIGNISVHHVKAHRAYNPGKKQYMMMPERKRISLKTTRTYRQQLKDQQGEE